ncbi:COG1470 family protein [Streptacidiphilus anmyonensis]|uniref:COG1470 family protein n=1 Tax=Streptacidiphilus anmyonensis TaxID=405782 RepID=UPI0005A93B8D|nr:hypothetical protein [Streptacidiphilus anmyonensis]
MGVTISLPDEPVRVAAGQEAGCEIRLRNDGGVVDEFLLDVLGDAREWAQVTPDKVNVLPGEAATARLTLRPPRSPRVPAGELPFAVRAVSREDVEGSSVEEGTAVVGPFTEFALDLLPRTRRGRGTARFRAAVDNLGNAPLVVELFADDEDAQLAFRFRESVVTVAPGMSLLVPLKARPRQVGWFRRGRPIPFQVLAVDKERQEQTAVGALHTVPLVSPTLLKLLVLAGALVIAGVVLLATVFRPTPTQSAVSNSANTQQQQASAASSQAAGARQQASGAQQQAAGAQSQAAGASSRAAAAGTQAAAAGSQAAGAQKQASGASSQAAGAQQQAAGAQRQASGADSQAAAAGTQAVGAQKQASGANSQAAGAQQQAGQAAQQAAQARQQASQALKQAQAAQQEAAAAQKQAQQNAAVSLPALAALPPGTGTVQATDARLRIATAPATNGAFTATAYTVPAKATTYVSDLVLQNPDGDTALLEIRRGGTVLLEVGLTPAAPGNPSQTLDEHFTAPLQFDPRDQLVLAVACTRPGTGATCDDAVLFSGRTVLAP